MELSQPSHGWGMLAVEHLAAAGELVSSAQSIEIGLYGGVSGVGWTVEHVGTILSEDGGSECDRGTVDQDDSLSEIDRLLLHRLDNSSNATVRDYDLIGGLVGIGVYFLERLPRPTATQGIKIFFTSFPLKLNIPSIRSLGIHLPRSFLCRSVSGFRKVSTT